MSEGSPDAVIGMERSELRRRARSNPGVVHLGYLTGQLALYFDPPTTGISRVTVNAIASPPDEEGRYYDAVVHRVGRTGDGPRRQVFRHPIPAMDWLLEVVPDFDLLETVCVNDPSEA